MNKKAIKIISAIFTVAIVLSVLANSTFALAPNAITANDSAKGTNEIKVFGGNIMGVMQTVGTVVAVLIIIVLGIKYMMGSASEKAEYKKTFIPYIVGAILIFGATTVATVAYEFAQGL